MRHLFDAGAEARAEQVKVVTQFLRRGQERLVGQGERASEVVAKTNPADIEGARRAEIRLCGDPVGRIAGFDLGDLEGDLEIAGGCRQIRVERKQPGGGCQCSRGPST